MSESKHRAAAIASGLPDPGPSSPNNTTTKRVRDVMPELTRNQRRVYNEKRSAYGHDSAVQFALRSAQ